MTKKTILALVILFALSFIAAATAIGFAQQ